MFADVKDINSGTRLMLSGGFFMHLIERVGPVNHTSTLREGGLVE